MVQTGARKNENPTWNTFYTEALVAAQGEYPGDPIAQRRVAERAADRAMHVIKAAKASSRDSQKLLVDQAFLEVFGNKAAGGRGPFLAVEFFPDRVLACGADGKLYEVSYTVGIDGVTFGNPQLVTLAEIEAPSPASQLATAIERAARLHGIQRDVEVLLDADRKRRNLELEESGQMLAVLAAYSQALVAQSERTEQSRSSTQKQSIE